MSYDARKWAAQFSERRRRWVRWTLPLGILGFLTAAAIQIAIPEQRQAWAWLAWAIGAAGFFSILASPFQRAAWVRYGEPSPYDERELAALREGRTVGFGIMTCAAVMMTIWGSVAATNPIPFPHSSMQWISVMYVLLYTALALPALVAEWRVPFPPAGDE